jgi:hypothetical protein
MEGKRIPELNSGIQDGFLFQLKRLSRRFMKNSRDRTLLAHVIFFVKRRNSGDSKESVPNCAGSKTYPYSVLLPQRKRH